MVQVSCGQSQRFLKCARSRKDFASWLFDLNDMNYFILETRIGSYLFDAEFNGRGICEPAYLVWHWAWSAGNPAGLRQRAYSLKVRGGLATGQVAPDKGGSATAFLWWRMTKRQ